MTSSLETILYTAHTHTTGGRNGSGRTDDGALELALSPPGSGRPGTNPEQLFGIGYSACFIGALQLAAGKLNVKLPADTAVDADVSLGKTHGDADFQLAVTLNIHLPGLDPALRRQLVEAEHRTCPYSRMTRGYVEVDLAIA
ncbi:Organic hydroperoxide resistance protein [Lysobacter capsici AZ78]|uniref:Organic hydroperoxide resistance protein n=1 Tax=Lysobacter capsici AZ78 TaxID=1444315 RepID=A0A120AH40_9GAMM|nr:organic hydroperoxide resistance protein [Lysobacter capsici]KWS05572.1 Organic hydroperoxide resistance protein [Lysobacter capsici AZ78]